MTINIIKFIITRTKIIGKKEITCSICGKTYKNANKSKHFKTMKHIKSVNTVQSILLGEYLLQPLCIIISIFQ